jgi:hypothetical protein
MRIEKTPRGGVAASALATSGFALLLVVEFRDGV